MVSVGALSILLIYNEIMNSIIEPPKAKKRFADGRNVTKLEIVLMEMRTQLDPIYRSVIYNIAHIYGGSDVAFTIFVHIDAISQVNAIIDDQWENVRIFNVKSKFHFCLCQLRDLLNEFLSKGRIIEK